MERIYKNSKKRNAIYEAVCSTKEHPSAEWVYARLKPAYPDLSLGTVYRNLNFFKENGSIISVGIVNGQERFDGNVSPHAHFICACCGRVLDLDELDIPIASLYTSVEEAADVRVTAHRLTFTGLCNTCAEEAPSSNE